LWWRKYSSYGQYCYCGNIIDLDKSSVKDIFDDTETDSVTSLELKDTTSEKHTEMPYYAAINEISTKLISFLHMEEKLKQVSYANNVFLILVWKASHLVHYLWDKLPKVLLQLVKMTCRNGHVVKIVPKMINKIDKWNMKIFVAKYKWLLLMWVLDKGLNGMAVVTTLAIGYTFYAG